MKLTIHCFAYGVKIDRRAILFPFRDMTLSLSAHHREKEEELILELSKSVSTEEISIENEARDDQGVFLERRMRPYKELITEAAQLVEGLLSIFYLAIPPKFETDRIIVNVLAESPEEEEIIKSGKVMQGFGNIMQPPRRTQYNLKDNLVDASKEAINHLPALSFLAQGIRSQDANDQEIAFFLYFRIIDGYFSDGAKDVEEALLKNFADISKYITYNDETKNAAKSILDALKLPSKSSNNFEGFISDIVLIRHKLTHFSKTNAERHSRASIKPDLNILNFHLRIANIKLLLDQIGVKPETESDKTA
jgi:hypothetical protein